jgi:hypothetical protein
MNTFDQCLDSNMTYHTWNAVSDVLYYISELYKGAPALEKYIQGRFFC